MAKPRQKASGKWEIGLRHPSLPHGRKYFTFDTEAEAIAYSQQWKLMKDAGLQPPRELLDADNGYGNIRLSRVLGEWEESGYAAPTQILTISTVNREVGTIKLTEASYKWLQGYIQWLKVEKQLTPQSIRHRVQCLGRAIDEYLRNHPAMVMQNPTRLLPLTATSTQSYRWPRAAKQKPMCSAIGGFAQGRRRRSSRCYLAMSVQTGRADCGCKAVTRF